MEWIEYFFYLSKYLGYFKKCELSCSGISSYYILTPCLSMFYKDGHHLRDETLVTIWYINRLLKIITGHTHLFT
jgi:hypothetical protein